MATRGTAATLNIVIAGDATGSTRAIRQAEGDVNRLGDSVKTTVADMARAFLAVKGVQFLGDAVEAASSLEQAQGKVDAVFGNSSDTIRDFAKSATEDLGQSEQQALDAAGTFGNLFSAFGIGNDQAVEMSTTLVTLASDLARFNDTSIDEAITALRAGLSGESEPLKRFGVVLNDARLRQEALNLGIYEGTGVLDANQKAQASYSLILKDTATAQGATGRESDSIAAKQAKLTAEWENAKATLGGELIPAMQAGTSAASGLLGVFSSLPGELQVGILTLSAMAIAGDRVGQVFSAGVDRSKAFGTALGTNVGDLSKINVALAGATAGVVAYTATTAALEGAAEWERQAVDVERLGNSLEYLAATGDVAGAAAEKYGEDLSGLADAIDTTNESVVSRFTPDDIGDVFGKDIIATLIDVGVEGRNARKDVDDLDKKLAELANQDPEAAQQAFQSITRALREQGLTTQDVALAFDDYDRAVTDADLKAETASRNEEERVDRAKKLEEEKEAAADRIGKARDFREQRNKEIAEQTASAVEDQYDRILSIYDAEESLASAQQSSADAQEELSEARRAAAGDSDEYRNALEAIQDAEEGVQDAIEAEQDAVEGVSEAKEAVAEAGDRVTEAIQREQDAREALTEAQADAQQQIEDLAEAARDAVLDEAGSEIAVRKAQEKLRQVLADQSSTQIERDEAALAVREAQEAARQAGEDTITAQQQAQEAARLGVEGNEGVIAARRALADAGKGVTDAEKGVAKAIDGVREAEDRVREAHDRVADAKKRVADASRAAAKVITAAEDRVEDASRRVADAVNNEARAFGDLAAAQAGPTAGLKAYRDRLLELAGDLAPGTPLRARLEELAALLFGIDIPAGQAQGTTPIIQGPQAQGGAGTLDPIGRDRAAPKVEINQTINGTSVEAIREAKRQAQDIVDGIGKQMTGG